MTAQQVWDFTPDEFAWVWVETGFEMYPDPISILETPTTKAEYRRVIRKVSARYPRHGDPDLTAALRIVAKPELRILCVGRYHDSPRRVRSLGAAMGDRGVVLVQKSGRTADFGGNIKLFGTPRASLGERIAATMPTAPAGTADGKTPVEEHIRQLQQAPRTAEGHLRIERCLHDERPNPPEFLSWIDVSVEHPAAGRYLIEVDNNNSVVMPAAAETIALELNRRSGR